MPTSRAQTNSIRSTGLHPPIPKTSRSTTPTGTSKTPGLRCKSSPSLAASRTSVYPTSPSRTWRSCLPTLALRLRQRSTKSSCTPTTHREFQTKPPPKIKTNYIEAPSSSTTASRRASTPPPTPASDQPTRPSTRTRSSRSLPRTRASQFSRFSSCGDFSADLQ
jgi:hypothetical protein